MKVVDAATLKGDGSSNQDRYLIGDYYAAVFDGASAFPSEPTDRDGGWFANELAEAVQAQMTPSSNLQEILRRALEQMVSEHQLRAGGPSSTVALVRWDDSNFDCLVLGDSPIAVMLADGRVDVITDRRLSSIGADKRAAYRERLEAGGGFDREHTELLGRLQAEQRKYRNAPRGFWIAADDPAAADQAISRRFPLESVGAAVLMTDGASAAVDRFGLSTWGEIPMRIMREGSAQILAEVNHAEGADPVGRNSPRSKQHDDKTAVLVAA